MDAPLKSKSEEYISAHFYDSAGDGAITLRAYGAGATVLARRLADYVERTYPVRR